MDEPDTSQEVQKFGYRFSRLPISLEIELRSVNEARLSVIRASCNDISEVGLGAELDQRLKPGAEFLVVLPEIPPLSALNLRAQVTHSTDTHCGFRFIFASEDERAALTAYMAQFPHKTFPV